jgi:hypothetical protein
MDWKNQELTELKKMIYYLAVGIEEWKEEPNKQSEKLNRGLMLLMKISLPFTSKFPNNLFDLYNFLTIPFEQWDIKSIEELFDGQDTFVEDGLILSQAVTDFIREYESPAEEELIPIKHLLKVCRSNSWDSQYRKIREFLSTKENAVLLVSDFHYALNSLVTEKELRDFVIACYENIPRDIDNYRVCPNCGWTLELRKGEWKCNSHKICEKFGDFSVIKRFDLKYQNQRQVRLKSSIQKFVLLPGLQELKLYKSLKDYKPILYPNCDQYDIDLQVNSNLIHLDIKDVQNPKLLASLFNEMGREQQNKYVAEENVYIVIPNYLTRYNKGYMKILINSIENKRLMKRVISERKLKQMLKRIGELSNAI